MIHRSALGLAYATIRLDNPKHGDLHPLEVEALSDTGSLYLCVPESVKLQRQLEAIS